MTDYNGYDFEPGNDLGDPANAALYAENSFQVRMGGGNAGGFCGGAMVV